MQIHFTTLARSKADFFLRLGTPRRGFLIGELVGDSLLVADLVTVSFSARTLNHVYPALLDSFSDRLQGPFFFNTAPLASQWFLGKRSLEMKDRRGQLFEYLLDSDRKIIRQEIYKFRLGK